MTARPLPEDLAQHLRESVRAALAEDLGPGDLTAALVPAAQQVRARVIAREPATVCGSPWFDETFRQLDPDIRVDWRVADGDTVAPDQVLCELAGPARPVLTGERTALNFLQLLSGTATAARRFAEAVAGTGTTILDTRKTIPGLRLAQKYAVRCGGAQNHRIGLFDAILVKENHILAAGGISAAVAAARATGDGVLLEVEVETLEQARTALRAGVDRLLLDNFDLAGLRAAVALRDAEAPGITLEASGGITLGNVRAVAGTGIDFISVGELTKSVHAIDLSMRFHD